jgi:hypothetical protein
MSARRLWRLRKLHQAVDADVRTCADGSVELRFSLNGESSYARTHPTLAEALAEAAAKRADLEREGFVFHW